MKTAKTIAIIDYGAGNLQSIFFALRTLGAQPVITEDADSLRHVQGIVLPGVGAFGAGMAGLKVRGLDTALRDCAQAGVPILGICLGAQLLFSTGYEFGTHTGLGIIAGDVIHFPPLAGNEKVPHVGWNSLYSPAADRWEGTILTGIAPLTSFYFVHSYVVVPTNEADILARTHYGGYEFASVVRRGNIYGCQFHPEKSAEAGLTVLKNFINL